MKIYQWTKFERKRDTGPERVILLFWSFVIKLFCGTSWYRIALTNGHRGMPALGRIWYQILSIIKHYKARARVTACVRQFFNIFLASSVRECRTGVTHSSAATVYRYKFARYLWYITWCDIIYPPARISRCYGTSDSKDIVFRTIIIWAECQTAI